MASIKNLVKFAAKFFEMGKDKKKAKAKPVAKSKSKPAAKKSSKPAAKKVSKPVAKKAAKPAKKVAPKAKKVAKPVKKAKPVVKKTVKPVVKKAVKPAPKKAVKPVAKKVVQKKAAPAKPIQKKEVKQVLPVKKAEAPKAVKPGKKVSSKTTSSQPAESRPVYHTQQQTIVKPKIDNTPQMRYSDEDLKEFRELIEGKLNVAREELKNLKESLDNHTESQAGNKAWNMEEGTDTSEMEYLMNQISRQHQYIRNLELALVRIENKTYGICRVTGKLIPKERLRVVPHATMSLEAKMSRKTVEESPASTAAAPPADFSEGFEE
jgi:RNA polymerase-binding transcription factor DksA